MRSPRCVRKAGLQVPSHVLSMLARRHPTVSVLWDRTHKCFCLVQTVGGRAHFIRPLQGRPTLANTTYYLDSIHPRNFTGKYARERFLKGLDQNDRLEASTKRAKDQLREGHSEMFNQLTKRRVFSLDRLRR